MIIVIPMIRIIIQKEKTNFKKIQRLDIKNY